jgi:membrane protein DedA with SNARE-associated domain
MEEWLQHLFEWLPEGSTYYLLLGSIAFLESIIGLGLLVPGSVIVVFAGFLVVHGKGEMLHVMAAAALGAYLGDLLSYWLGARAGMGLLRIGPLKRRLDLVRKAEIFFVSHGGKSIFFGRFVGPLRGFIPFVGGCTRMPWRDFHFFAVISALLWGLAYPGLGYLGGASWQRVQVLTGRFSLLIGALLVLFVLNGLFWKKLFPHLTRWVAKAAVRLQLKWQALLNRPQMQLFIGRSPRFWSFVANRFTIQHSSGLYLTAGLTLCIVFALLSFWALADMSFLRQIDDRFYQLFMEPRPEAAERVMLAVAHLASGPVIIAWTGFVLLWLILENRDFSAVILLAGVAGGYLLGLLHHALVLRPRPQPLFPALTDQPPLIPGENTVVLIILAGLAIYFLLGTTTNWQSGLTLVIGGSFAVLLVPFSRIYLGISWFSYMLAAFALAAVWLSFLLTAAEIRRRYAGEFPWRPGWQPLQIKKTSRQFVLTLASLAILVGTGNYILARLAELG